MIPFPDVYQLFLNHAQQVFSPYAAKAFLVLDHAPSGAAARQATELIKYAESSDLRIDQGEVFARCGVFLYNRGEFDRAKSLFTRALHVFHQKEDHLNQAYVCCMLHYLYCALHDPVETSIYAHRAMSNFLSCEQVLALAPAEGRKENCIYLDIAKDIAYDLISDPEEAYRLINEFSESKLSPSSQDFIWEIDGFLRTAKHDEVIQGINLLLETTRQSAAPRETAEALVYSAIIMGGLGETAEAVKLLKSAVVHFFSPGHEQAFALWMLALYQFRLNDQYTRAVKNVERALENIHCLEIDADRHHKPYFRLWYETLRCGMQRVSANRCHLRSSHDTLLQLS